MAKRRCPNCGSILAPIETASSCGRCAMQARLSTPLSTDAATGLALLGGSVATLMNYMQEHVVGWLRVVPSVTGSFYFKYKYTSGTHRGKYIFYELMPGRSLIDGWIGISEQIDRVVRGDLKPSPDIYR